MKRIFPLLSLAGLLLCFSAEAITAQECKVRVVQPVTDDMGHAWHAGAVVPVDIERDNTSGGTYCASGGSCLPRMAQGKDALAMLNCKVGPSIGSGDFRLVPDERLAGKAAAGKMKSCQATEQWLSAQGLSNASAGTLADAYVNHPQSGNGRLVAQARAGSRTALATLKRTYP